MEYVDGPDLQDCLDPRNGYPTLSQIEAHDVLYQLLEATAYLHGKGVTHRDIKPANIIMATREPMVVIKLVDFGLATKARHFETYCGTRLYCAPGLLLLPAQKRTTRGSKPPAAPTRWTSSQSASLPWRYSASRVKLGRTTVLRRPAWRLSSSREICCWRQPPTKAARATYIPWSDLVVHVHVTASRTSSCDGCDAVQRPRRECRQRWCRPSNTDLSRPVAGGRGGLSGGAGNGSCHRDCYRNSCRDGGGHRGRWFARSFSALPALRGASADRRAVRR